MTNNSVEVVQADRDAASSFIKALPLGAKMIVGYDFPAVIQAFALHRINSEKALAAEMPTIWEDPAGKGYPCFERPMTPAEAKQTIERWGARIVELENAAQALAERVREALKPFADALGEDDQDERDDRLAVITCGRTKDYTLTLGDFRRLRSLDLYRDA